MNLSETAGETIASTCSLPTWLLSCEIPTPTLLKTNELAHANTKMHVFIYFHSKAAHLSHVHLITRGVLHARQWERAMHAYCKYKHECKWESVGVWETFFTLTNKLQTAKGWEGLLNTCKPALKTNVVGVLCISRLHLYWDVTVLPNEFICIKTKWWKYVYYNLL